MMWTRSAFYKPDTGESIIAVIRLGAAGKGKAYARFAVMSSVRFGHVEVTRNPHARSFRYGALR